MKFTDTLRGLLRRWYIVVPGIIIAAAMAFGAWFAISPGYDRSATQLLIPGASSMPEGANPYLFLGGLAPAADVLVRALGSENVLNEVVKEHPGAEIKVLRDTTTAGPIIVIEVTARSDADAKEALEQLVALTATVLTQFQEEENIPTANRMTVIPVTVDKQSVLLQRSRLVGTVGVGIAGLVLTFLVAGLVDGFGQQRRRRGESAESARDDTDTTDEANADESNAAETNAAESGTPAELDTPVPAGVTDPAMAAEDSPVPLDQPPDVPLVVPPADEHAPVKPSRRKRRRRRRAADTPPAPLGQLPDVPSDDEHAPVTPGPRKTM